MSSRSSRRSAGNTNQLNRCTIPLWDKKRLVKELHERGLDTSGTQPDLAERLLGFLDGIVVPTASTSAPEAKPVTPAKKPSVKKTPAATPKTPKPAKSTPKAKKKATKGKTVKTEEVDEEEESEVVEEAEEQEEAAAEVPTSSTAAPPISVKEEPVVNEEEAEAEPSEPVQPNRRNSKKQNKENATPAVKPKRRPVTVKTEPEDEDADGDAGATSSDGPSSSAVAATEQNGFDVTAAGDEKRSRRKSARLLASEQMEVDEEPTTEDEEMAAEEEPAVAQESPTIRSIKLEEPDTAQQEEVIVKPKEKEKKLVRVKEEVDSDDSCGKIGKAASSTSSSDPDFQVNRPSKHKDHAESSDSYNYHHQRKVEKSDKVKKIRHSTNCAPVPPPKPKQSDWQVQWAAKMAEHKKKEEAKQPSAAPVAEKKNEGKPKGEQVVKKKKQDGGGSLDTIAALMSSTIAEKEKVEKKPSVDVPRVGGGSDATATEYSHGFVQKAVAQGAPLLSPHPKPLQYPTISFFNPPVAQTKPQVFSTMLPPPPPPPMLGVAPRRRSRFDQPPVDFPPQFYAKANAPPPTLTTAIQISRRSSPPPPPPPKRTDGIPPPPPRPPILAPPAVSSTTTDLQRRVQELFAGESSSPVPVVFAPPTAPPPAAQKNISPPPPPPPPRLKPVEVSVKRPLVKEELQEDEDEDGDEEFVIRDTVIESSEPAAKMIKLEQRPIEAPQTAETNGMYEEPAPKAINKAEELKKKAAINEERRRRAMELGEGEYDPMEAGADEESTLVYDYRPSNAEDIGEVDEMDDEEMDEAEDEEDEEAAGDEEEEQEEESESAEEPKDDEDKEDDGPMAFNDARDLLKILPVLDALSTAAEARKDQYAQIENDIPMESLLKRHDEEKPEEVYYHGEPVPEVDENELYEIAAGIKPKKKDKKPLVQVPDEERLPADVETIELDYYNADIHVKSADKNIWQIEPFCQDGLALMWGGVRSNFGITLPFVKTDKDKASKLGFQIQIEAFQSIQHLPTEFMHDGGDVRIGFSLGSAPIVLGEYTGSWCITASGKRATNNHFYDFGHTFDIGDVVTCILDLVQGSISYLINGKEVGTPYDKIQFREGDVIFPTICTKNSNINVNLGQDLSDEKWSINEDRDWMFITEMDRSHLVRSHVAPGAKKDCTVLMTVGLPGVGKTTWVRRYLAEHPHEHWTLISADMVMDAMKVNGVSRIRLPSLKRPDFLRGIIGKSMARLILLAPRRRKNYILDMTNCMADKRKRKLMAFEEFNRKCMVFVPEEDVHQKRLLRQEHAENEKLDTDALMQHKAAMSLPTVEVGEPCEEVIFIDPPPPNEQWAFDRVAKMNYECRSWLVVPGRRRGGGGYHSHGHGGNNRGNYHNEHYQPQFNRPSTSGPPSGGNQYGGHSQPSPRPMTITHTTFSSGNSGNALSSPSVSNPVPAPVTTPFNVKPPIVQQQQATIILPPVKITTPKPQVTSAQPSPVVKKQSNFSFPPVQTKVEVSQPLTLNTSLPRKSFDMGGPSSALSSGGRSSFSASTNSPRFGYPSKELMTPTSVPPQALINPMAAQPSPLLVSQPPPMVVMPPVQIRPPPVMPVFPIDVTVPPPNFTAPPPPLRSVPPHLLMFHQQQMSVPPPTQLPPPQFPYPPPQFAPR
ncbi:unnamed protein product [Caenorhabditis sp. 36 PRJEB53466]|nr:unnamed protein product [Caenorhabditis sp. 36 PRJEB53466]